MVRAIFSGSYRTSALTAIIVVAALAYIISPIDIVPDVLAIVGWIDDAVIFFLAYKRLSIEAHRYVRHKAMERRQKSY